MNKIFTFGIISAALFLAACEDPAANKPRATVSNSSTPATATPAQTTGVTPAGELLALTPDNSSVEFTGSKVTGKHDGGFKQISGSIDLVNGRPEESSVRVEIETSSIYSDADGLTDHLKTADFFDVQSFPKATFTSTKIEPDKAKGADNYTVTGDLEMRGQKKSITFPAVIKVDTNNVWVKADFSINRKDFGMAYAGKADDLIRDDVVIRLDLNTPRKK